MHQSNKLPTRAEISVEHKWNLEDIYSSDQAWERDLQKVKEDVEQVKEFRGKLKSAPQLGACLNMIDELNMTLDKLICYSYMRKDEDNASDKYQGFADKATTISVGIGSALAFVEPEILELNEDEVKKWVREEAKLATYSHYLANLMRTKAHTLPAEQEEILASAGEIAQAPSNVFKMFNNADLTFPEIKDEAGNDVELTHGRYIQFLECKDRAVRERAFTAMYATYGKWKNTLAATYTSAVKQSLFFAKTRKYKSSLEASLDSDNVQPEVYYNLISTIHEHLPLMHKYVALRKKLLGVDELHMYDLYVPMVKDVDMKVSPEQAVQMVKDGLAPLGEKYTSDLAAGFEQGWIDWYENKGKTSGAYSWGPYGVHPFVLMNYQNSIDNMFTLAHEMGHAMHSFYSNTNQDFLNSQYPIFLAEVASTLNESLVMANLLEKTTDPREKMYLINHYLEQFKGTVFRQTMFAEFEMKVHEQIGSGEPMTAESLSRLYYELNKQYFGDGIVVDEAIAVEWARIPHFYRPFYVYKYATGFSAAVALSEKILKEGDSARDGYLQFLGQGGSDYPLNLLRLAGVDMGSPKPITQAMKVFASLLAEMEELAAGM